MKYKIDLHVHTTTSSCSGFSPQQLVEKVKEFKPYAVTITNHHNYTGDVTFLQEKIGQMGIPFFAGMEITNNWGDFLLFGKDLKTFKGHRGNFPTDLLPDPDIAVVWAHPYRFMNEDEINRIKYDVVNYIDAIEGVNGNCLKGCPQANYQALNLAEELDLPTTAGSDSHNRKMFFMTWTEFDNPIETYDDLIFNLKQGNFEIEDTQWKKYG
ncbi:MAG: PHP-associated domain-containing protein [Vulcanimicrobiota bacterium]